MAIKLSLKYPTLKFNKKYNPNQRIYFIGSCFAENSYLKFTELNLDYLCNPFGVVFNPISIDNQLKRIVNLDFLKVEDLQFYNENYFHWDISHKKSNKSKSKLLEEINHTIARHNKYIATTDFVFITLGTSWVYETMDDKTIVANCHKLPSDLFTKRLLQTKDLEESIDSIAQSLFTINPNINIIWSISPVRHSRDGLHENNISKSGLHLALHKHISNHSSQNYYFPAYELLIDCLRDYRFYSDDLVHPNDLAINLIFEYLISEWLDEGYRDDWKLLSDYTKLSKHIPFSNSEKEKQLHSQKKEEIKNKLVNKFGTLKFLN